MGNVQGVLSPPSIPLPWQKQELGCARTWCPSTGGSAGQGLSGRKEKFHPCDNLIHTVMLTPLAPSAGKGQYRGFGQKQGSGKLPDK